MKKWIIGVFLLVLFFFVLMIWYFSLSYSDSQGNIQGKTEDEILQAKMSNTEPDILNSKQECETKGGSYIIGGHGIYRCYGIPTADGGKTCSDGSDCEGECVAELTDDESLSLQEQPLKKEGRCSDVLDPSGYFVDDGLVRGYFIVD